MNSIPDILSRAAARYPRNLAIADSQAEIAYQDLDTLSNQLASHLLHLRLPLQSRIALCLDRTAAMATAILAVLKTGAAYVPLDPAYPPDRIAHILADARPAVILAGGTGRDAVPHGLAPIIDLEAALRSAASESPDRPEVVVSSGSAAYLIYTSASTGDAKGVVVSHQNICHYVAAMQSAIGLDSGDRFLHTASFAFSSSVRQLFWPLSRGATVALASKQQIQNPIALLEMVKADGVTILDLVPTYWRTCVEVLRGMPTEQRSALLENRLRLILSASERLLSDIPRAWREEFQHPARMINMYGQTETAGIVAVYPIPDAFPTAVQAVPIGTPIPGASLYLLDEDGMPVPAGSSGEIHVGGAGIGLGYHGQTELTAQRFLPDRFSAVPGARLYRTGDLGRARPDGIVEYVGRLDQQIKIRGFRVEPGEIESALMGHAGVTNAAVLAVDDALVAFVVGETVGLRAFLKSRLPDYMVPAHFVPVERIPLNPNGKVDRRALAAGWHGPTEADEPGAAVEGSLEESILAIWREVLRVGRISVQDNLFDLGGHSLSITRIVARLREAHGVQVPFEKAFENPTVAGLAGCVRELQVREGLERLAAVVDDAAEPRPNMPRAISKRADGWVDAPLSSTQRGLWLLDQMEPGSPLYVVPLVIELAGPLNIAALERALATIVQRHESLRTVFPAPDGEPVQRVLSLCHEITDPVGEGQGGLRGRRRQGACPTTILNGMEEVSETEAEIRKNEAIRRPFDLQAGPLFRAELLRLGPERHQLAITMHHIVADDWSIGVLIEELVSLYEGRSLADLPIQYCDYAVWQQAGLQSPNIREQLSYWEKQLAGPLPVLELQAGHPRPAVRNTEGAKLYFEIAPGMRQKLSAIARQHEVTLFMTLLAAFQILLSRYTGQTDLLIGSPVANRPSPHFEGLIGAFIQTLVLRCDLSGNPTFQEVLRRTRRVALDAYTHQDIPFEDLVQALAPDRDPSRPPVFQVMFVLQNAPRPAARMGEAGLRVLPTDNGTSKFDLSLTFIEEREGLSGELEYNTGLFDRPMMERLQGNLETLLQGIVADPARPIAELPLLTAEESRRMLEEWNRTTAEYPSAACLHQLFEAQVERTPEATAVVFEESSLTYAELNRRANRMARYLRSVGVGEESLVALSMDRSLPLIVALIGILKAGAAYVPIDPAYPRERKQAMLEDSQAEVVVTSETVSLSESFEDSNPAYAIAATNAAYVIYTSGSTAQPKGVVVTHQSVVNHAVWFARHYGVSTRDRVLQFASISFDAAAEEIYPFLFQGAAVVLRTDAILNSAPALVDFLQAQAITVLDLPTAFWQEWTAELAHLKLALPEALRLVVVGGEKVSLESLDRWRSLAPPHILWSNTYGPTEATISTSYFDVTPATTLSGVSSVPIGRPVSNATMYVLDQNLNLVPAGVPGELHIGGDALARGYLRRPEATLERFIPVPPWLEPCPKGRLYKTGDLVRALPDGNLEFIGRVDNQVKLRGFRIELGEIEAFLDQHNAVQQSVAVVLGDGADKMVVAYVAREPGSNCTEQELKDYLRERVPSFMIPSRFVILDRLPLNANGKVDRRALPAPFIEGVVEPSHVAPTTASEKKLAAIWCKVLKREQVSIRDNFFDLGGHSLKATQVMARIRDQFGTVLPLTTLFQAPTIEQLAVTLDREDTVLSVSPVNAVQSRGTKRPLFCIHPDPVYGFRFNRLAEHLGGDQPLYGIQPISLDGGRILSIEEIAANSIREMRAVQAEGPYALLGYCFGGFVVYEMAQQLRREGHAVALMGLLDSVSPTYRRPIPWGEQLALPARRIAYHWALCRSLKNEAKRDYFHDRARNAQSKARRALWRLGFAAHGYWAKGEPLPDSLRDPSEAFIHAGSGYCPTSYPGAVAIFRARIQAPDSCLDPALGWGSLAQTAKLFEVPGGHDYLLVDPNVSILARHLQELLQEAPVRSGEVPAFRPARALLESSDEVGVAT